ncbi:MAG: Rab family GTPase [Candidatus Sigynarchaeota archaeon]
MDVVGLKIAIIGDQGVGKTSLVLRYTKNTFPESYMPTLGADFSVKEESLANGKKVQLYLWDLAGNPTFKVMRQYYLAGSHVILVCFAVDDPRSFQSARTTLKEISRDRSRNLHVIVVGTKGDLKDLVNKAEIDALCKAEGLPYVRTSAKTGENVHALFIKAATTAIP